MGHRYRTDPSFGDACNAAPFMLRTGEERKPDLQGDLQAQAWHAGSPGVQGRQGRLDRLGKKAGHGRAGWQCVSRLAPALPAGAADSPRILLVSLKAGGVGLNLTAATRVHLLDPWWNSSVEEQAMDRVHRLGQTQPVHIFR